MPSLSTSFCMLLVPGTLPCLRNLTILMSVYISHKIVIIIHVHSVVIRFFRKIKIFIIILYKMVDAIEVFGIKMITLYATVSFDRSDKELCLICIGLGDFHIEMQCKIITLILWPEQISDIMPRLGMVCLQANRVTKSFLTDL